jgi:hypothetical protein
MRRTTRWWKFAVKKENRRASIIKAGKEAEEKVEQTLEKLKKERKIASYLKTKKFSPEDKAHIDFKIYLPQREKPILLSVKSHIYPENIKRWRLRKITPWIFYQRHEEEGIIFYLSVRKAPNLKRALQKIILLHSLFSSKSSNLLLFF